MVRMTRMPVRLSALGATLALLAACDESSGGSGGGGVQSLGGVFQQALGQAPTDPAVDVDNAGLEVNLGDDPFAL